MGSDEALEFIKEKDTKNKLLNYFVSDADFTEDQLLICMAGSSGAGKTETAKSLMKQLNDDSIVRVDADEIKEWIVKEKGGDINDYHNAAVKGVNIICDYCFKKKKNFIIDGTFVDYEKARENIKRALSAKRNYTVIIVYVYQDPILAWKFIKKRSEITNRKVPYSVFCNTFIQSIENVVKIKEEFKKNVVIHTLRKNFDFSEEKYTMNVDSEYLLSLQKNVTVEYNTL